VFPTRFRAFAHGISAAMGKVGAIISALAFNTLSQRIGTPAILWIFFGCCMFGACECRFLFFLSLSFVFLFCLSFSCFPFWLGGGRVLMLP
jgi:hypothetical protein